MRGRSASSPAAFDTALSSYRRLTRHEAFNYFVRQLKQNDRIISAKAILQFGLFLDELKRADQDEYNKFMSRSLGDTTSRFTLLNVWNQLSNPTEDDYVFLQRALESIQNLNEQYFKKDQTIFSVPFISIPDLNPLTRDGLDHLKELAQLSYADPLLTVLWSKLKPEDKAELAEVLDGERLLIILQQQKNDEFREAKAALENIIDRLTIKESEANHGRDEIYLDPATKVLDALKAVAEPSSKNQPIYAELAYRTAVGLNNPLNSRNLTRYPEAVKSISKIEKHSTGEKLITAAMIFSSVLLFGAMAALIMVATGGVGAIVGLCIAGAILAGSGGIGFSVGTYKFWKKPSPVKVAAMSFLKSNTLVKTSELPAKSASLKI